MLQDKRAIYQVLGCLLKDPSLLGDMNKYQIIKEDFPEPFHRAIFGAIWNLYKLGNKDIDHISVDNYLSNYTKSYEIFLKNDGIEWCQNAIDQSSLANFDYYYIRMKKFSLLRECEKNGVSVTDIYNEKEVDPSLQAIMQDKFDKYDINDIIKIIDTKILGIKEKFVAEYGAYGQQAGKGAKKLKEELKQQPEMGVPLCSGILNSIVRGARLKKLYMRSAPTGVGKTRLSVGDACNIAIDEVYDTDTKQWTKRNPGQPTLFITTELEVEEVQTMCLAFISGVAEEKILDGKYTAEEEARVDYAVEILERCPLWIEHMPNFDVNDIEHTIKKYIILENVRYIFFDYIHTSMKLLEEIANQSKGMRLREDNVLLMFVDRLKGICNQMGVFIFTSTQVNGEWKSVKDADQNLLRGSKAMADKLDVGIIALEPTKADLDALRDTLNKGFYKEPNMVYHIYKNRRGKIVRVKLWLHVDLSTCRTYDLFVTDKDYKVIPIQSVKIILNDPDSLREKVKQALNKEVTA